MLATRPYWHLLPAQKGHRPHPNPLLPPHASPHTSAPIPLSRSPACPGVSMEVNRRHLAALRHLLDLLDNRLCADCSATGAGNRPSWASINCGVFICMRCAGVHRGLGTHVSKVRVYAWGEWGWKGGVGGGKKGRPHCVCVCVLG
jgi:hypothetical protein